MARVKYLDPKFSSPANSRAYVEGWERCFGEEVEPVRYLNAGPGADWWDVWLFFWWWFGVNAATEEEKVEEGWGPSAMADEPPTT